MKNLKSRSSASNILEMRIDDISGKSPSSGKQVFGSLGESIDLNLEVSGVRQLIRGEKSAPARIILEFREKICRSNASNCNNRPKDVRYHVKAMTAHDRFIEDLNFDLTLDVKPNVGNGVPEEQTSELRYLNPPRPAIHPPSPTRRGHHAAPALETPSLVFGNVFLPAMMEKWYFGCS